MKSRRSVIALRGSASITWSQLQLEPAPHCPTSSVHEAGPAFQRASDVKRLDLCWLGVFQP
jgi:hypothetical protein